MKKYLRNKALEVVESGYDRIGERYTEERGRIVNWREVEAFTEQLPVHARVLDAGSGTGIPITEFLVKSGYDVVGIDISKEMLSVARKNIPGATFHKMSMAEIDFPPDSFDGVISCYAIIHNPRETHAEIFKSFHRILKPGGVMLVSVASWAWEEFADYMGEDMFWSHYEPDKTQSLITDAGFEIEFGRDVESGDEKHHWVLACKYHPKSLKHKAEREARRQMLRQEHILPLTDFVDEINREQPGKDVPYFDPLDGGIEAQCLFVLESPGRMTKNNSGSGFISRNNNDDTAKSFLEMNVEAGMPRKKTVTWNIVPWDISSEGKKQDPSDTDIEIGLSYLYRLIDRLPNLRTIVLLGNQAKKARHALQAKYSDIEVFDCPHPSPQNIRTRPEMRPKIIDVLTQAREFLDGLT